MGKAKDGVPAAPDGGTPESSRQAPLPARKAGPLRGAALAAHERAKAVKRATRAGKVTTRAVKPGGLLAAFFKAGT